MKDIINIKHVNDILKSRNLLKGGVEDNLFDFTVGFYHCLSLIKPTTNKKTTKEFVTFLFTKCLINFCAALQTITDEAIDDLDKIIEHNSKLVNFNDNEACNYFINIFNCETDQGGAFFKLSSLYCILIARYGMTNDDVIECIKTIN